MLSRPTLTTCAVALAVLTFGACKPVYSDMFSYRKNSFKPPIEKVPEIKMPLLPPEGGVPPGGVLPPGGGMPGAPGPDGGAIPGLPGAAPAAPGVPAAPGAAPAVPGAPPAVPGL